MIFALLLLVAWAQPACQDLSSCREQAIAAKNAGDFEAFHDLAWAAYGKGKQNDPELMLLVARAQSLSGRPGDALVMLERIAGLEAPTDAATSDDFARVRALPRWPEVADKFAAAAGISPSPNAEAKKLEVKTPEPKPEPKKPEPELKGPELKPEPKPEPKSKVKPEPEREPKTSERAEKPEPGEAARSARLSFTTVLSPDALAYDAVSRRFLIADRKARRVAIVDESTGQVSTLVGAQGGLGDIGGIAIDPQQGDLWVVSTGDDDGPALHRVQLISGRVMSSVSLKRTGDPVALAFVRGTGLVLADATGAIWKVDPRGSTGKLAGLEYVPEAVASDTRGRLYLSGGAARIGRYAVASSLKRIDVIELDEEIPPGAPFAVIDSRLHFVVPVDGRFELRSSPVK